jgi:hypothetical protein
LVDISLTNNEWYFLYRQMLKGKEKYPNNRYFISIFNKLEDNMSTIEGVENESKFKMEYECIWIGGENL